MSENQKPAPVKDYMFRGFLAGLFIGLVAGAITEPLVHELKRYPQVWIAFCGLASGLVGLTTGLVHRLVRKK